MKTVFSSTEDAEGYLFSFAVRYVVISVVGILAVVTAIQVFGPGFRLFAALPFMVASVEGGFRFQKRFDRPPSVSEALRIGAAQTGGFALLLLPILLLFFYSAGSPEFGVVCVLVGISVLLIWFLMGAAAAGLSVAIGARVARGTSH